MWKLKALFGYILEVTRRLQEVQLCVWLVFSLKITSIKSLSLFAGLYIRLYFPRSTSKQKQQAKIRQMKK